MAKAGLLFVGTDDGLVLFSNPNNIGRWLRIGQPFRGQAVRAVWAQPDNPLVVYAAVAGAGLQRSDDGGQGWRVALDAEITAINGARDGGRVFALDEGGALHCATPAAEAWTLCRPAVAAGRAALAVLTPAAQHLAVGAGDGVWVSDDGGATWARFGDDAPGAILALAAAPGHAAPLYAVAGERLYSCAAAAAAWEPVGGAPAARGPLAVLGGKTPVVLLAQAAGGIARSDNGGATWSPVGMGEPISALIAAPYHIDTAFAGTRHGALAVSADRGRGWESVKDNLPAVQSVAAARLA